MNVYVIGSLRNPKIPEIALTLRDNGFDVFDDWYAAGPEADDYWKKYEQARGRAYLEALEGYAVNHVFSYDKSHLDRCDAAVLVLPAGRSGHLELGYFIGGGKPGFILLPESPTELGVEERWDAMYRFATKVVSTPRDLVGLLNRYHDA